MIYYNQSRKRQNVPKGYRPNHYNGAEKYKDADEKQRK